MFELGKLFTHAPGHPMKSVAKARDLLGAIDETKPPQALVEVLLCSRNMSGDAFVVRAEVRIEGNRIG